MRVLLGSSDWLLLCIYGQAWSAVGHQTRSPILPPPPHLLVGLWGARSLYYPSPTPWLACRCMRSQILYYPSPTPWLACRFMRSQVLHYPFPSFPKLPWFACRFMRSQVLYCTSPPSFSQTYPLTSLPTVTEIADPVTSTGCGVLRLTAGPRG